MRAGKAVFLTGDDQKCHHADDYTRPGKKLVVLTLGLCANFSRS